MLKRLVLLGTLIAVPPAPARACPVCDRETGREVRAGIFDRDFGVNLLATTLPFGVFLGVVAAIHLGLPGPGAASPGPGPGPPDDP